MALETLDDDPLLAALPRVDGYPLLAPCLIYGFIGRGGMGTVYLGRHLRLSVDVAVKVMRPEIADRAESWVARFRREAGLAARVSHQHLVRAYDVLAEHGLNHLVMELVRGENLRQRVERVGPLPVGEACALVAQAASGLAAAHAAGIVHRDVKPDNVLVSTEGVVKVADLGLAKAFAVMSGEPEGTLHTVTLGTPRYMAPEQWEDSRSVGPPTDVYALASTLWFLLAGRDARPQASLRQLMRQALAEPHPDIREVRDDVPDWRRSSRGRPLSMWASVPRTPGVSIGSCWSRWATALSAPAPILERWSRRGARPARDRPPGRSRRRGRRSPTWRRPATRRRVPRRRSLFPRGTLRHRARLAESMTPRPGAAVGSSSRPSWELRWSRSSYGS